MKKILILPFLLCYFFSFSQITSLKARKYTMNSDTIKVITKLTSTLTSDSMLVYRSSDSTVRKRAIDVTSAVNAGTATDMTGLIKGNGSTLSAATAGVDYATVSGTHYEAPVKYVTTGALAANTYNNGTSGVGATLTGNANGSIGNIDGVTPSVNDRVLIKNEATQTHNGAYAVTTVGDVSNPYVLTRVTDWDQSAEMAEGDAFLITAGNTLGGSTWWQQTTGTITPGSSNIVFIQAGSAGGGLTDPGGNGIVARTALNTTAARTITGTTNQISVANGDGSGNPTISIPATLDLSGSATTFNDDKFTIQDNGTPARKIVFDAGSIVSNTTKTITMPDADLTLVSRTLAQTWTAIQTFSATPVIGAVTNTGTLTFPTVTGTITQYSEANITSNATWSPQGDARDNFYDITAQAVAVTTISNPSGTPANHNTLLIRAKCDATPRALSWSGTQWRASTDLPLPATLAANKTMYMKFIYNSTDVKWDLVSTLDNF